MLQVAVLFLTAVTLASGLFTALLKYGLLPWLRENLVKPVNATHRQVTVNHHSSPEPTLLDKLDDVIQGIQEANEQVIKGIEQTNERLDTHLDWSHEETRRIWHAIITGKLPSP